MFARYRFIRVVSVVPVAIVVAIFAFEWYAFNILFELHILHGDDDMSLASTLFAAAFNSLWLLALWSYLRCSLTDPGFVTDDWRRSQANAEEPTYRSWGWQPGLQTFCKKCQDRRPERTHHCSICGRCVLRMDHHCPWIGNCVGVRNHKFFLLMNFYGFLSCLVFVLLALPQLLSLFLGRKGKQKFAISSNLKDTTLFSLAGMLAASFGVALSALFFSHCWLIARNLTSIEVGYGGLNPYNVGMVRNAKQILGAPSLLWFLPLGALGGALDGISYPLTVAAFLPTESNVIDIVGRPADDV